jgi:3-methyl-2-oxobutanoate hydroxymethyltransferase
MTLPKKTTLSSLAEKVASSTPLTMITCYDYSMAHWVERAGIDMVLVGDSLGMTMLGYDSTLPVTMEDIIRHGRAVRKGAPTRWLIADMPYMSYQPSDEKAIESAGRLMAQTASDAVKLEGGREVAERVRAIADAGIPVMGHLGLTPQSASALGGFRLQGKTAAKAFRIIDDARVLEDAGAFSILLELVPDRVCEIVTRRASIPIISLGAGPRAHGQLLIFHDALGLYPNFKPRMARVFADAGQLILTGLETYAREVSEGAFPCDENTFRMSDEERDALERLLGSVTEEPEVLP